MEVGDLAALRALAGAVGGAEELARLEQHVARPRYRPGLTAVLRERGAPVGYALLSHRRLRLGAATLDIGVVERAASHPGAGDVWADLVRLAAEALYHEGLPLMFVRARPAAGAGLGLAPFQHQTTAELRRTLPSAALAPADAGDADDLAALYEGSYAGTPLSEVRGPADWRALLEAERPLALYDSDRRMAAYARLDDGAVVEAAAADSGAARALLAALAAGAGPVTLMLPASHRVTRAALQLGAVLRCAAPAADAPASLAGVVDLDAMIGALGPELERRLSISRYAGWSGSVAFELATGGATLAFAHGRVAPPEPARPADVRLRRVSLIALPQLLLGYRDAADLRATGDLVCDDIALGLLDALFPVTLSGSA